MMGDSANLEGHCALGICVRRVYPNRQRWPDAATQHRNKDFDRCVHLRLGFQASPGASPAGQEQLCELKHQHLISFRRPGYLGTVIMNIPLRVLQVRHSIICTVYGGNPYSGETSKVEDCKLQDAGQPV